MRGIDKLVLEYVLHREYGCATFTDGSLLRDSYEYRSEAITKINALSNMELLELIDAAVEWRESGEEIGL